MPVSIEKDTESSEYDNDIDDNTQHQPEKERESDEDSNASDLDNGDTTSDFEGVLPEISDGHKRPTGGVYTDSAPFSLLTA